MPEITKLIHKYLRHDKKFPSCLVPGDAGSGSCWARSSGRLIESVTKRMTLSLHRDHRQIPACEFGKGFDGIVVELEGAFGKFLHRCIACTEHQCLDSAVQDRTRAHWTRLAGCIKNRAGWQRAQLELLGCKADGIGFRMARRIGTPDLQTGSFDNDLAVQSDDCPEGLLAHRCTLSRFGDRQCHEVIVVDQLSVPSSEVCFVGRQLDVAVGLGRQEASN